MIFFCHKLPYMHANIVHAVKKCYKMNSAFRASCHCFPAGNMASPCPFTAFSLQKQCFCTQKGTVFVSKMDSLALLKHTFLTKKGPLFI